MFYTSFFHITNKDSNKKIFDENMFALLEGGLFCFALFFLFFVLLVVVGLLNPSPKQTVPFTLHSFFFES